MLLYLVSGSGSGAGKTTLAEKLAGKSRVWSIASALRGDLQKIYPDYNWYAKDQAYKNTTMIRETGKSMRDTMVMYGQQKCEADACYWVNKLATSLEYFKHMPTQGPIAIDDLRKTCELHVLKERFPQAVHFHVVTDGAVLEPQYQNPSLLVLSDYLVEWK